MNKVFIDGGILLTTDPLFRTRSFLGASSLELNRNKEAFSGIVNLVDENLYLTVDTYESINQTLYATIYGTASASGTLTVNDTTDNLIRDGEAWEFNTRLVPYQNNNFEFKIVSNSGSFLTKNITIYCDFNKGFSLNIPPSRITVTDITTGYIVDLINEEIIYDLTVRPAITTDIAGGLGIKYGNFNSIYLDPDLIVETQATLKALTLLDEVITLVDTTNNFIYHIEYDVLIKQLEEVIYKEVVVTGPISWLYTKKENTCPKNSYYYKTLDENKYIIKVK